MMSMYYWIWFLSTVVVGAFSGAAAFVVLHRVVVRRRTRELSLPCLFIVAEGNGRTARCHRFRYHLGDHAASLESLASVGYVKTPF